MTNTSRRPFPTLDAFLKMREELFAHFGHNRDWFDLPVTDGREYFWRIVGKEPNKSVRYHECLEVVASNDEDSCYEDRVCANQHLPKWIYRANGFTMICVNPNMDGHHFLHVFDNDKEVDIATEA